MNNDIAFVHIKKEVVEILDLLKGSRKLETVIGRLSSYLAPNYFSCLIGNLFFLVI